MRRTLFVPLLLAAVATLAAGCAGTKAAYSEAQSLDEYAFVLTEHYSALVREAADLKEKPTTPAAAVKAMQDADTAAHLVVVGSAQSPGLAELAQKFAAVKSASSEAELQAAVDAAVLRIADLVRAVKAARAKPSADLRRELLEQRILAHADRLRLLVNLEGAR